MPHAERHRRRTTALILPGIGDSGPGHWQTLWEMASPSIFKRVHQRDWEQPVCADWLEALEKAVSMSGDHVVLVAHSLACLLVVHWAAVTHRQISGALLVAPPDPDAASFPEQAVGFSPLPIRPLPFQSIVVASTNDPYGAHEFARSFASALGSRFVSIGAAGHINAESGLGEWREGISLFRELTD